MTFSTDAIAKVWEKARYVNAENEKKGFRKDQCGAWINFNNYGDRESLWGWEIDHITPVADGGPDVVSNLRPLHWKNNLSKSDGRLVCAVKSDTVHNVAA